MARPDFGTELRRRRTARRYSQLGLAAEAGVSQRHLSFLETGRSHPSREMVVHLGTVLDLPLRDRNRLLVAAGFAPIYSEARLDDAAMDQVRSVIEFILDAHEPYPAIVVDRLWYVVMANRAATRLTSRLIEHLSPGASVNIAHLTFAPEGLRTVTVDWERTAAATLLRLEREVTANPGDDDLAALFDEVLAHPGVSALRSRDPAPSGTDLLVPVHYHVPGIDLELFTTISTIGAAFDVTVEELRLETFFPADPESDATLRRLAEDP